MTKYLFIEALLMCVGTFYKTSEMPLYIVSFGLQGFHTDTEFPVTLSVLGVDRKTTSNVSKLRVES
jgi:hypothetical protein